MGGGDYDRDPPSRSSTSYRTSSSGARVSDTAVEEVGRNDAPDPGVLALNRTISSDLKAIVIIAIDDTGSMGEDAFILRDKMPMVWRQTKGYLGDPAVCVALVGDADSDEWPLQVGGFVDKDSGKDEDKKPGDIMDDILKKEIHIEGNGGGQGNESYELMGWYFLNRCEIPNAEKAFLFFLGDEGFYPDVYSNQIRKFIGVKAETMDSRAMWEALKKKFHVFRIHRKYGGRARNNEDILNDWISVLGADHVLTLEDVNAVADDILGCMAYIGAGRSEDQYKADMEKRGQDPVRVEEVLRKLRPLAENLALVPAQNHIPAKKEAGRKRSSRAERL